MIAESSFCVLLRNQLGESEDNQISQIRMSRFNQLRRSAKDFFVKAVPFLSLKKEFKVIELIAKNNLAVSIKPLV